MSERIEAWQKTYEVTDADGLRTTLDESLSVEERRERECVVDDWGHTERMRTLVSRAIRLYDDLERFAATNSSAAVGAGGDLLGQVRQRHLLALALAVVDGVASPVAAQQVEYLPRPRSRVAARRHLLLFI